MGARPSSFKKGGGFLNNVDATIVDYEFTDDIITKDGREEFKAGKYKNSKGQVKERFHALNGILTVLVDGATEPVTTTLFAGGAEDFDVSDEGHTLTPVQEGGSIGANTGWGKLISSLCAPEGTQGENGFPEENFPGDDEPINFEAMIGTRVRLTQKKDEEATTKYGKRKSKDGKKEYDRTDLVVDEVYEVGDGTFELPSKGKKGVKKATNGSGKPLATKGKGKPAPVEDEDEGEEVDEKEVAEERLRAYLSANGNSLSKAKLRSKALMDKKFSGNGELREAVCKLFYDDKWLKSLDGVIYDKTDKAQMVSLEGDE